MKETTIKRNLKHYTVLKQAQEQKLKVQTQTPVPQPKKRGMADREDFFEEMRFEKGTQASQDSISR